jgi:HAMP domain-containing protein
MTQIAAWLDQHQINAVAVVNTVVILVLASIFILVFSRFLWRWLTYLQGRLHPVRQ